MKKYFIKLGWLIPLIAAILTISNYAENYTPYDLSGEWVFEDTVKEGPYKESIVKFIIFISQDGINFNGEGEKISLNNKSISSREKSRIELINGKIDSDIAKATFREHGKNRETRGSFKWKILHENKLLGEFKSTSNSKGISLGIKK